MRDIHVKDRLGIAVDYISNALKSAAIGALVSAAIALALGEGALRLDFAGACVLIGVACGTCSKAVIEGAFSLFGARRSLAYLLNAAIIAAIVVVAPYLFFGGFEGLEPWVVVLIFALPELASVFIVRAGLGEASRIERAFDKRREELEEGESQP